MPCVREAAPPALRRILHSGRLSAPVLRSVIGSAPPPLRGSWRQQPREAVVSAAMIAPCAGEVLRAAVVARKPLFMRFRRGGGMVARVGEKLLHIAPTHPAARLRACRL
jgi:hypothetical protein